MPESNDRFTLLSLCIGMFLLCGCIPYGLSAQPTREMKLVWSDEFSKEGAPDTSRWSYQTGDGCPDLCGWGNNELQYYTDDRRENARVRNGFLIIEAHREKTGNSQYSSAKLISRYKGDWTYGRMDIRARLPKGRGVWPAIWMLPTDWAYGDWPKSGEIDIMEFVGYMPDSVFGSIHTQRFNHLAGTQVTKGLYDTTLSNDFHEYSIEWDAEKIVFLMDDVPYQTFYNQKDGFEAWPFDRDFHMILNVAVGGNWGGKMGVDESIWPQKMLVDYVRVYQYEEDSKKRSR